MVPPSFKVQKTFLFFTLYVNINILKQKTFHSVKTCREHPKYLIYTEANTEYFSLPHKKFFLLNQHTELIKTGQSLIKQVQAPSKNSKEQFGLEIKSVLILEKHKIFFWIGQAFLRTSHEKSIMQTYKKERVRKVGQKKKRLRHETH